MNIQEIQEKETWNSFIETSDIEFYSFLQSWEWGEVQKSLWKEILRLWAFQDGEVVWVCLIIKTNAKRGRYALIPHGPLVLTTYEYYEVLQIILQYVKPIFTEEWFTFMRINSTMQNSMSHKKQFSRLGFRDAPMHEHVEDTHILDIKITEDELLKNIKKKDRYYINRAIKEWVKIMVWNTQENKKALIDMHTAHSKRENGKHTYTPFSQKFIEWLYNEFWEKISTISASFNWNIESVLITIRFWKTCVYYIAASDIKSPKFSPNYLCQWEAIKKAKDDWCEVYNFWGVSPDDNPKHPIAWVSVFKRKFAGKD